MLEQLVQKFGDAGLVFLVMAIIIYFLYKEFKRERKAKGDAQQKHVEYVEKSQHKQLEVMSKFSRALDGLAGKIKG